MHVLVARVVVELEADLVAVELDRPVDVADREYDDFEGQLLHLRVVLPGLIHAAPSYSHHNWHCF